VPQITCEGYDVLKLALLFFITSLFAGFFGFSGLSTATAGLAKMLFFVALAIFVICIAVALAGGSLIL
jgi:uncharacterized membrane protein YtjA (UPF0391 family)